METLVSEKIIENSLVKMGNTSKLKEALKKEKIKIAFLGGSITQGFNSTEYEKCYAHRTYLWFKNKFNKSEVEYINAGIGATGSIIGVHRVYEQVIEKNPDIVFVDASVNDKNTENEKISYESLVRKFLKLDNEPAIIELFMTDNKGNNVQEQQVKIGERYNIPMISFRDAIYPEILEGRLKWTDILTDEVHPNDYGHFIISTLITSFVEKALKENSINEKLVLKEPIFGDDFIEGTIKNSTNIEVEESEGFLIDTYGFQNFKYGWKFNSLAKKTSLLVETKCKNIFLLYKKTINEKAGKIKVTVDNEKEIILDTFFENGWGDYSATEILVKSKESFTHEIKIELIDFNEESIVNILGFLVS